MNVFIHSSCAVVVRTANPGSLCRLLKITMLIIAGAITYFTGMASAQAYQLAIQAEFKPNSANPQHNTFKNTTPSTGGYCSIFPTYCATRGIQSLKTPIKFISSSAVEAHHLDPRQGGMISVLGDWRELTVKKVDSQEIETVRVRFKAVGTSVTTAPDIPANLVGGGVTWSTGHALLWQGGNWGAAPAPCRSIAPASTTSTAIDIIWEIPVTRTTCAKQALFNIPKLTFNYLEFIYELETPNPLGMSTGQYKGSTSYSLGPYQDFDMGDKLLPNDTNLTLNFTLTVLHTLKVDIPPGGNKIELTPQGGWQQWLQKGRTPEKLYRDQPFLISASSRFKMLLSCERMMGNTCAISNGSHEVPVDVLVSIPNGVANDGDSSVVSRKPLSATTAQIFKSMFYVENRASTLHFEIQKAYVAQMLSAQGNYKGNITVIWDSDL